MHPYPEEVSTRTRLQHSPLEVTVKSYRKAFYCNLPLVALCLSLKCHFCEAPSIFHSHLDSFSFILFPQCLSIHIWHLHCVIQVRYACTFSPVANMAARRSGSLLFQRCIFCSRETLKRSRDFDARSFSRAKNTFLVTSNRSGIFSSSGENLLFIHF